MLVPDKEEDYQLFHPASYNIVYLISTAYLQHSSSVSEKLGVFEKPIKCNPNLFSRAYTDAASKYLV